MSRHTGPRVKIMRALGEDLPGLSHKYKKKRDYPPGEHGQKKKRRKVSDYGKRLQEKQKIRYNYGLTEKQLRRLVSESRNSKMATGDKLIELLETRLDNALFRSGFAPTIPAARQLVNHGHFTVNGKKVNIPSFRVSVGDVVKPREKSKNLNVIKYSVDRPVLARPNWIEFDSSKSAATIKELPTIDVAPFPLDMQLVIEYYSRLL